MVGPALRQLFKDLDRVSDRSDYEEALLQEIRPLIRLAARIEPIETALYASLAESEGSGTAVRLPRTLVTRIIKGLSNRMVSAPGSAPGTAFSGRGESDVFRLRCPKPDCPNKRL